MQDKQDTLVDYNIRIPTNKLHYMRLVSNTRVVRIRRKGVIIAESQNALSVSEVGVNAYKTVMYIPKADIIANLDRVPEKSTHCPLKGDASYYSDSDGAVIAWAYNSPLDFAIGIKDYIAFLPDQTSCEEAGAEAD